VDAAGFVLARERIAYLTVSQVIVVRAEREPRLFFHGAFAGR